MLIAQGFQSKRQKQCTTCHSLVSWTPTICWDCKLCSNLWIVSKFIVPLHYHSEMVTNAVIARWPFDANYLWWFGNLSATVVATIIRQGAQSSYSSSLHGHCHQYNHYCIVSVQYLSSGPVSIHTLSIKAFIGDPNTIYRDPHCSIVKEL